MRRLLVFVVGALSGCAEQSDPGAAAQAFAAADDLELTSVRESLTGSHHRYAQLAPDGTRVVGSELAVHLRQDGSLRHVTSNIVRPLRYSGARVIDAGGAAAAALAAIGSGRILSNEAVALPLGPRPGDVRAGWRVVVASETDPPHEWEIWIDGERGDLSVRRDLLRSVDGTGYVFQPNPITSTGDLTLVDGNNLDTVALTGARVQLTLRGLDGSGFLRGEYADVENKNGREQVAGLVYDYQRSVDGFEEVNAYYHIDRAQRQMQALGFTGAKAILAVPFHVVVNGITADNSFYSSAQVEITMGTGGVDDAEDGDVVLHEYGHAIQDDIVPGWGTSAEAGAIGEGFGDIVAASVPTGGPDLYGRECVAPWDATSYAGPGGCLRRVDGVEHYPEHLAGQVHDDGEIWSGAMWASFAAAGLSAVEGLQLVLEAQFLLSTGATMPEAAAALLMADADLHAGAHDAALRRTLLWYGLLADISPPDPFTGAANVVTTTVESAHPIADGADVQTTITHTGASAIRVHFASLDMEVNNNCVATHCDNVYLYDGSGRLYAVLGGQMAAFDAPAIPGDTVLVRWVSDRSVGSQGFVIDSYAVIGGGPLPDSGVPLGGEGGPMSHDAGSNAEEGDGGCGCTVGTHLPISPFSSNLLILLSFCAAGLLLRKMMRWRCRPPKNPMVI